MKHTIAICLTAIVIAFFKYVTPVWEHCAQFRAIEALMESRAHPMPHMDKL